jgi:hypothetical protein
LLRSLRARVAPSDASTDAWSGPRPFVGRETLVRDALGFLDRAAGGHGAILFIRGEAGAGKRRFIARILEANDARTRPMGVLEARAGGGGSVWRALERRVTRRRRIRRFLVAVVPEWAAALPVLGPLIAAILRTIRTVRGGEPEVREARITARRHAGIVAAVDTILAEAGGPMLVVLHDLERASDDDLAGAFHVLRALPTHAMLIVATVTTRPGGGAGRAVDLIQEAERYAVGETMDMGALAPGEWQRALLEATGTQPPPKWLAWFEAHSPLLPRDLWTLLGEAAALGGITREPSGWRWADAPAPVRRAPGPGTVDRRLDALAPDDRALLADAIADGTPFPASRLPARTGLDELAVQDRLARLERAGWIRLVETRSEGDDWVDWYDFARPGVADAIRAWAPRAGTRNP